MKSVLITKAAQSRRKAKAKAAQSRRKSEGEGRTVLPEPALFAHINITMFSEKPDAPLPPPPPPPKQFYGKF